VDQQIEFLAKIQRIFTEGEFTATYKFAPLIALSDVAVELGSDTGEPLSLDIKQVAEQFIGHGAHGHIALYRYVPEIDTIFLLPIRNQREAGYSRL